MLESIVRRPASEFNGLLSRLTRFEGSPRPESPESRAEKYHLLAELAEADRREVTSPHRQSPKRAVEESLADFIHPEVNKLTSVGLAGPRPTG